MCKETFTTAKVSGVSCPVYADLLSIERRVIVADIQGYVHTVDADSHHVTSKRLSSSPIYSGSVHMPDDSGSKLVVGCHDSSVYCLTSSDLTVLWSVKLDTVVYSRVLRAGGNTLIAATTAGDVYRIEAGRRDLVASVAGEVWSDPVLAGNGFVAFGARDSQVHLLKIDVRG